jgi:hypothetical protein
MIHALLARYGNSVYRGCVQRREYLFVEEEEGQTVWVAAALTL